MKQLATTHKTKGGPSKTNHSKGGSVTKTETIQRQSQVERLMRMGYSLTKIAAVTINDKKLGEIHTISKDMDIIRSRWLDQDPEWFHRARLARIEAKDRLLEQLIRLNELIIELHNGNYNSKSYVTKDGDEVTTTDTFELPKKLTYTESQLTTVIKSIYEIDADFDPEQYLDKRIQESVHVKIKEATSTTS